jgi:hypothetical protein
MFYSLYRLQGKDKKHVLIRGKNLSARQRFALFLVKQFALGFCRRLVLPLHFISASSELPNRTRSKKSVSGLSRTTELDVFSLHTRCAARGVQTTATHCLTAAGH